MDSLKKYWCGAAAILFLGMVMINHAAAEEEAPVTTEEHAGTVDAVHDNSLVINDSTVALNDSILLQDQGGDRMKGSEFKVGDEVLVVMAEDEKAGTWNTVSITRKKGHTSSVSQSPQEIHKVDGVWRNY